MSNNQYDYGKITLIKGVIETADGNYSEFTIATDGGWQQWGASKERLGHTVGAMEAMARALMEDDLLATDDTEPEPEPEYDLALLVGVSARHIPEVTNTLAGLGLTAETDGTGWRVWSEPVDEDDNDGVTHLVRIEVPTPAQGALVASYLHVAGLLSSDRVSEHDRAAADAIAGGPATILGYVTNADVYCEGYHQVVLYDHTADQAVMHDLLGR